MDNFGVRIMHVVQSLNCGGQEKMIISLAERQIAADMYSSICVLEGAGELSQEAEKKNIPLFYLNKQPGVRLSIIAKLRCLLKQNKITVMHAHNMGPAFYGAISVCFAGVPVAVVTRHGRDPIRWNALLWHMIDAVVAISKDTITEFRKSNAISASKAHVIYNGTDTTVSRNILADRSSIKKQFGISDSDIVIGSVGRLCPEKDFITLINAYKFIVLRYPNTKLLIVGGGKLQAELAMYCSQNGIDNKVIFTGFRNNIHELLEIIDIFVLSSISEGMPLALLEAMASGKPSVVTNVGGNVEVVVDGVTGFIVPPKTPDVLASRIMDLIGNKKLSEQFSEAAKNRVADYFSVEHMAEEYLKLYLNILERK